MVENYLLFENRDYIFIFVRSYESWFFFYFYYEYWFVV